MLDQEALRADELVTLHGDDGHRGILVAQIGARQFVVFGDGVLIVEAFCEDFPSACSDSSSSSLLRGES